jgi:septal ring factor EnvC (AmiA/AmiB activator)
LYNFKDLERSPSPPERLQKSTEGRKPKPQSKKSERPQSSGARLQELCPEDKAKIGELVKKLAMETKQKEEYAVKYEVEKAEMARKLTELESLSSRYESERERMRDKLKESVKLLKDLKDQKESVEGQSSKKEKELARMRDELQRRETEIQRVKAEAAAKEQAL